MQRVLIAEDNASAREGLGEMLTAAGYAVVLAKDGAEALEKFKERPFDVVLLDVWMPRMNGLQLLAELRTALPHPKVIVMTGDDTPETVLLTLKAHAHEFLAKPIRADALLEVLRRTLAAPAATTSIVVLSARPGWVELLVPCSRDIADRIPAFIMSLETELADDVRESMGLVFRELLLDVMDRDGYLDARRKLRIACLRARRMLMYRIADAGYWSRSGDLPDGEIAPPHQDRRNRGGARTDPRLRPGILLARDLADELLINEEMNEFVFLKYLD